MSWAVICFWNNFEGFCNVFIPSVATPLPPQKVVMEIHHSHIFTTKDTKTSRQELPLPRFILFSSYSWAVAELQPQ